jgi:hypothetical protein
VSIDLNKILVDISKSNKEKIQQLKRKLDEVQTTVDEIKSSLQKLEQEDNKPTKRSKKDPTKPKKALSSYLHFVVEKMWVVKASNANLKHEEVMKKLGKWWRSLNDVQRDKYIQAAKKSHSEWLSAMEIWKQQKATQSNVPEVITID